MNEAEFIVRRADWARDAAALSLLREEVFVREQGVPAVLEWDGEDPRCVHVLAESASGAPVGTGRLSATGQIGRMAVRAAWRGRGVGTALLEALIDSARAERLAEVFLNAQTSAVPFYQARGFMAEGEVFMEAGIPHRRMRRRLPPGG